MLGRIQIDSKALFFFLIIFSATSFYGMNYWVSNLYTTDFMVLSMMIVSVASIFLHHKIKISKAYLFTIILNLLMWVSGILVALKYELSLPSILKESYFLIAPVIVYIALNALIRNRRDIETFFSTLTISSIICHVLSFIEFFLALRGIDFLKISVFTKMRNGTPRFIIGEVVIVLAFFLSYSILIDRNKKILENKLHLINLIFMLINLLYIIKTRTLFAYILFTLLIVPLLSKQVKRNVKIILGFISLVSLIFIFGTGFITQLQVLGSNDYGIQMRFYEIDHYLMHFRENWLTGVGFLSSSFDEITYHIMRGPYGRYYTSDVGLIGLAFKHGIIGLVWVFSWFYTSKKIISKNLSVIPSYHKNFMELILVFFLVSCINLIFTDTPRFPYIAFGMLIIESGAVYKTGVVEKEI